MSAVLQGIGFNDVNGGQIPGDPKFGLKAMDLILGEPHSIVKPGQDRQIVSCALSPEESDLIVFKKLFVKLVAVNLKH
jgi:hypothetical protein